MRPASGEWGTVVEAVLWLAFRQLLRGLEGINLAPEVEDVELGRGDVDGRGGCGVVSLASSEHEDVKSLRSCGLYGMLGRCHDLAKAK